MIDKARFKDIDPAEFEKAMNAYCADPDKPENHKAMVTIVKTLLASQYAALIGPAVGIIDAIGERWKTQIALKIARWLEKHICMTPDRPALNYYWMARWKLTNSITALRQIHWRAYHCEEWPEVRATASWMVSSVRQQDSTFDSMVEWAERTCPDCQKVKVTA